MGATSAEACIETIQSLKEDNILTKIPFRSERKKGTIVVQEEGSDVVRVFTKGAPDFLLNWDKPREDKTEEDDPPVS